MERAETPLIMHVALRMRDWSDEGGVSVEDVLRPRRAAAHLRSWFASADSAKPTVAVDVDGLAAQLGFDVAQFDANMHAPGTLGFLEPGEDLIFLQSGLPEQVRRFTLAHELGHAALHRPWGNAARYAGTLTADAHLDDSDIREMCDAEDLDAPIDMLSAGDETLRPGQAYSARARRESEANAFASALLLPAERVSDVYLSTPAPSVRALAIRFGVSDEVVLRRLADLIVPGAAAAEAVSDVPAPVELERATAAAESRLDDDQRAAAQARTPALVVAGPGTGKTSTLIGRVAYLIGERGVRPDAVLALTFSNKAAREMRERLERLLGGATSAQMGAVPTVSTIHAFCGDLLRRYAPLVGLNPDFRLLGETEGYFLLRRLASDVALRHYQPVTSPAVYFPDLLGAISRAKDELVTPEEYAAAASTMAARATTDEQRAAAERAGEVALVYSAYQDALRQRGAPDFGDLIRLSVRLLEEHPEVLLELRSRYTEILVDEFQDINRAMGVLLRTLAGPDGPLWAVGDADQAIYRFRGASPANLSRFSEEYPASGVFALRYNYRSYAPVLEAAAAVAGHELGGGDAREALVARRGDGGGAGVVTLAVAADDAAEHTGLVHEIKRRRTTGRDYADVAVLCRTRRGVQQVSAALEAAGVPTKVAAPLLEQPDIKDILAVIELLVDQSGAGLLRAGNIADHAFTQAEARLVLDEARARSLSPLTVIMRETETLHGIAGMSPEGVAGLRELGRVLGELRRATDVPGGLARYLFDLTGAGRRLLAGLEREDDPSQTRALFLARLLSLAYSFEDQRRAGEAATTETSVSTGAAWRGFLEYVRVLIALRQEAGMRGDDVLGAQDAVAVLTVHASKGLEFPVVFLPGLADRRFPAQKRWTPVPFPAALLKAVPEEDDADDDAQRAEEACLFYVALTRARDELVLSYAEKYGRMRYKASPFLAPIERRLGDGLARQTWSVAETSAAETDDVGEVREQALPGLEPAAAVSASALETYARCPRQYAYQYVYALRPEQQGLATMHSGLRETLRVLEARFAEGDLGAAPALSDAIDLFEEAWETAERASNAGRAPDAIDDPYREVYRRHALTIVERAWRDLHGQRRSRTDVAGAPAESEFARQVGVRLGKHLVTFTLDRVDRANSPADAEAARTARGSRTEQGSTAPVRFVRHGIGSGNTDKPDLRSLFYVLAARQEASSETPIDAYRQHLATGASERIEPTSRQMQKLTSDAEAALAGMESGEYPAKPEPRQCQMCPFLLICPA